MTQILGMNTFLDSFEHPESYICLENDDDWFGTKTDDKEYIIIQTATHPDFTIKDSDSIIYYKNTGDIKINKLKQISHQFSSIKRYQAIDTYEPDEEPIYEGQIIGKVVKTVDDNLWNTLAIKLWEVSISNLNIKALG